MVCKTMIAGSIPAWTSNGMQLIFHDFKLIYMTVSNKLKEYYRAYYQKHKERLKEYARQYYLSSTYKCNFLGADNKQ